MGAANNTTPRLNNRYPFGAYRPLDEFASSVLAGPPSRGNTRREPVATPVPATNSTPFPPGNTCGLLWLIISGDSVCKSLKGRGAPPEAGTLDSSPDAL